MSYYSVLGLDQEPFSTSPDPDFFFDSQEHHSALMRLLVEIRLRRGLSLTPKASFGEAYESRFDDLTSFGSTRTYQDVAIGRYQLGGDLRLNSPAGYWDAEYSLKRRLKPDTMEDDAGAMDRGVEESLLSLQDTLMPRRGVVMRFGTGYDFRRPRDQEISFRRRVQPFFGDVAIGQGFLQVGDKFLVFKGRHYHINAGIYRSHQRIIFTCFNFINPIPIRNNKTGKSQLIF